MKEQKEHLALKAGVKSLNRVVDFVFVLSMLLLLLLSLYTSWDSRQVYAAADPNRFITYKPDFPDDIESFEELQEKYPDVKAWLTIYDTEIDYPLVQTDNDDYYMNHDIYGEVQSSGSLFLDYRNSSNFSDFNTLIYGHHMSEHKMFGDIDLFLDEEFFNEHEFGNLFYDGQDHGIQIIAILEVEAHDWNIYSPNIKGEELRLQYIEHLYEQARYIRGVSAKNRENINVTQRTSPLTPDDHMLLLSTCSADITNGRFILVCKQLDHTVANPFPDTEKKANNETIDPYSFYVKYANLPFWAWVGIILLLIILTCILYKLSRKRDQRVHEGEITHDSNHS